jgi:HSP20 family protein
MRERFFTLDELRLAAGSPAHPEAAWAPAVDVYRCPAGWLVKFELAGVRQEDIHVRLDSRGIRVFGTRLDRRPYDFQQAYVMEISYSRFERFVEFPEPIEDVQYHVELADGMLYVHVLRTDEGNG